MFSDFELLTIECVFQDRRQTSFGNIFVYANMREHASSGDEEN